MATRKHNKHFSLVPIKLPIHNVVRSFAVVASTTVLYQNTVRKIVTFSIICSMGCEARPKEFYHLSTCDLKNRELFKLKLTKMQRHVRDEECQVLDANVCV